MMSRSGCFRLWAAVVTAAGWMTPSAAVAQYAPPPPTMPPPSTPAAQESAPSPATPPGPTQAGPAGNAHPESERVSGSGQLAANPFGRPTPQPALTIQQRLALAEAVDLEPLRDLAVLHNGRVKILDTLARETVANVHGA
jgi:hypothetical protein